MIRTTDTEENYLKAIFKHSDDEGQPVSTNTLAAELKTTPASVTDMIKKLSEKELALYTPYKGVSLTEQGRRVALNIIRKQRLWEVFLVEKLSFTWDEVHEIAEQLEHIQSSALVKKLDEFLGFPRFDPHGDPIPDENGHIAPRNAAPLSQAQVGERVQIAAVLQHSAPFLQYLNRLNLTIGAEVEILERIPFDDSLLVRVAGCEVIVSAAVTHNVLAVR